MAEKKTNAILNNESLKQNWETIYTDSVSALKVKNPTAQEPEHMQSNYLFNDVISFYCRVDQQIWRQRIKQKLTVKEVSHTKMVHQKIGDKLQVSTSQECNPEGSEKGKGKGKGKRGKGKQGGRCTKKRKSIE